jgi:SAM-dependent methyltransferase
MARVSLLSSAWLRRVTQPVRARAPRLYAALNRARRRLIVGGGRPGLDTYQVLALERFRALCRPRPGARVLEIGSDLGLEVLRELRAGGGTAYGINLTQARGPGGLRADARALPFADGAFDFIFSIAAFEHIHDLPRALAEMHRVLVPGGMVYANFGPIWSSGRGHHVVAEADGEVARHNRPETNPLPDFVHLVCGREELAAGLAGAGIRPALARAIVAWVYDGAGINRMCFHEYLEAFRASPFALRSLRTEEDAVAPGTRRLLRYRVPAEERFEVTNVEAVLAR